MGGYRVLLAPAVLAGALVILVLSPVGQGRSVDSDGQVWRAIRQLGAQPAAAVLEAQFLLAADEGERFIAEMPSRLLPGATLRAARAGETVWEAQDGARLLLRRQPVDPAVLEAEGRVPDRPLLVELRLERPGRGAPDRLADALAAWSDRGPVYRTYAATMAPALPAAALEGEARRLVALLGGRVREGMAESHLASYSGYSPLLGPGRRTAAGTRLNVQVALRALRDENLTLIYVGLPLLPGSF